MSDLEPHTVVLLRWPAEMPSFEDAELSELQSRHLAYLDSLRDRGALLAAGPLAHQPDESWRGLCIYSAGPEEAASLAAGDPSVQAGRLEPVVLTWLARAGEARFGAQPSRT